MTDRFDRIKAPERRLLERAEGHRLDAGEADPEGRVALFTQGRRHSSTGTGATVHCSSCDTSSPVDAGTAVRNLLPLFLVAPWRSHPVFAVCPSCRRRAWLRPSVGA